MAGANSNIQLSGLDFDTIKTNFKTFLQSQDTFKDYNFEGSGLSTLIDVLAYNTQYNAFYLNMVANEMFLDTALQRSSVISHAKLLDYIPTSQIAAQAFVDINVSNVNPSYGTLTLPAYTKFVSESVDGINYDFVAAESMIVNVANNTATFSNVSLLQGLPITYQQTVDSTTNPTYTFNIPDSNVDITTLVTQVYQSSSNSAFDVYTNADNYLSLDGSSKVYFLDAAINDQYNISFGDGILGKKLVDGNIVVLKYIVTQGNAAKGANNYVMTDSVTGVTSYKIVPRTAADNGRDRESIDSIKFQAPKSFASQKRAVTKDDYISLIQRNSIGITFDAVSVWGGEDNDPPSYGHVYICLKPKGSYVLSDYMKNRMIQEVIKPISILTIEPIIVDPDYTFVKTELNVYYDPIKTNESYTQFKESIRNKVSDYLIANLNTFNSTLATTDILVTLKENFSSFISGDIKVKLEKRTYPNLSTARTYKLFFGAPLDRGVVSSGISSYPSMSFVNPSDITKTITGVYFEEIPNPSSGISSIQIANPGYGYQYAPTITINGDGSGANATAEINTLGQISKINITSSGNNYTSAAITITNASGDTSGRFALALPVINSQYGTLRSYYFDSKNNKVILNENVGTVDYENGVVTLNSINPVDIDSTIGELRISANPKSSVISSSYDRILSFDTGDLSAININLIAKNK